jgi:hypothetical protein
MEARFFWGVLSITLKFVTAHFSAVTRTHTAEQSVSIVRLLQSHDVAELPVGRNTDSFFKLAVPREIALFLSFLYRFALPFHFVCPKME